MWFAGAGNVRRKNCGSQVWVMCGGKTKARRSVWSCLTGVDNEWSENCGSKEGVMRGVKTVASRSGQCVDCKLWLAGVGNAWHKNSGSQQREMCRMKTMNHGIGQCGYWSVCNVHCGVQQCVGFEYASWRRAMCGV
ncbi:hypothetical protein AVEN_256708-1 [Araneus ventricosus]|uniref:Uncharacterized protein n=1 Tax=Araneus ventricosus TaxID=182803 RepID=A0A4Y2RST2_ARAVE|nr:hypothetical protein AVEN_256708-1 [Araneus ventricosus]